MALQKRISGKKAIDNTGLNTSTEAKYARFVNKDGTANIVTRGTAFFNKFGVYNFLINLSSWKFAVLILAFYTLINLLFAVIYYLFCLPYLRGIEIGSPIETFEEVYFFSSQTLTTVGYGRISPSGFFTNTIASFEALTGILTLAIITGLLYGRFGRPKAYIRFSTHALIAPFRQGKAMMFRVAPIKNATLSEVNIKMAASMMVEENGKMINKYFDLPLQFDTINTLYISWTVVHPIDENSPINNLTSSDLRDADFELVIYLKAFDEDYSSTVIARTSYTWDEIVNGAKFVPVFFDSPEGKGTIVDLRKLNQFVPFESVKI